MVMTALGEVRPSSRRDWMEKDYCSKDGAAELAAKIESYWAERGHLVSVSCAETGFHPTVRHSTWIVRSTLRNGLPYQKTS